MTEKIAKRSVIKLLLIDIVSIKIIKVISIKLLNFAIQSLKNKKADRFYKFTNK